MTASRSVASETNGGRSSAGGGRAFALDSELVSATWFPVDRRPVERALTGRGGLLFALMGLCPRCGNLQAATELGGQVPP